MADNQNEQKTEIPPQKTFPQPLTALASSARSKPRLLYILILILGLLLGNFIFAQLAKKVQTGQAPKTKTLSPEPKPLAVAVPAALPNQPAAEDGTQEIDFVLNGVFFSDQNSYALINNQIVRENDYIGKAKVGAIKHNSVELESNGEIITLSTQ